MRRVAAVAIAVVTLSTAGAHAETEEERIEACARAAEEAEPLAKEGKLVRARKLLQTCVPETCPKAVRAVCQPLLVDVESGLATVVVKAVDGDGRDVDDAPVSIDDGEPSAARTNGRPLTIDPGSHSLRAQWRGERVEEHFNVHAGERLKLIQVKFSSRLVPTQSSSWPVMPFVLGGVGVVGVAGFVGLGLSARGQIDGMRDDCAPRCSASAVDSARATAIAADISLGIGVIALGVATWLWLTRKHDQVHAP
jgi:hypothetical protein